MSLFAAVDNIEVKKNTRDDAPFFSKVGDIVGQVSFAMAGISTNPKRSGQPFVLVKFEVVSVRDGDYNPGELCSWYKSLIGQYNLEDIKRFGGAIFNVDPNDIGSVLLDEIFAATDEHKNEITPALVGHKVNIRIVANRDGKCDKSGQVYVNTYFSSHNDDTTTDAGF
ncbi:MAG: hypothetical protein KAI73_10980 [Rhodospirillaceae bacterium]|nr:hypothetical protein [Rhodospirillaceae bacterium]